MIYKYGDICIAGKKIDEIVNDYKKMRINSFSTGDFIEEYRKCIYEPESRSVGDSWNAHFGKVLSDYARKTVKIKSMQKKDSNGTELWEII